MELNTKGAKGRPPERSLQFKGAPPAERGAPTNILDVTLGSPAGTKDRLRESPHGITIRETSPPSYD